MSKLLDIHEFCQDLKEIKTSKIVNNRGKFTEDGLFSEQIFGPVKNYTCQCKVFYGQSKAGEICKICGVEIVNSGERRKRFAKIVLPMVVVNPMFYDLVLNIGGLKIKSMIDSLMSDERSMLYKKENKYVVTTEREEIPEGVEMFEKTDAIYKLVYETALVKSQDDKRWKYILDNVGKMIIKEVIVLPCDLRPASKTTNKKNNHNHVIDRVNDNYRRLLMKKESIRKTVYDINSSKKIFYQYYKPVQRMVNDLYTYILNKMSKKNGLIRGNILGKRIDFSGRAVIVPDPSLNLDECKLPYFMFMELFKIQIAKRLTYHGHCKFLNDAIRFIDKCIKSKIYQLHDFCVELLNEDPQVCLLNRQPSLHRLSMLGFKIKLEKVDHYKVPNKYYDPEKDKPIDAFKMKPYPSNVIKIHPLVCPCFNADFDGDQMAVYVPISKEAKDEIFDKFLITNNLSNPANGDLTTTPSQDIILGIYALTTNKFTKLLKKTNYKGKRITQSMKLFNECLPDDYDVINFPISEKELMAILNDINKNYDEQITANVLDKIKKIGFKYATLFGPTMSLDMCKLKDNSLKDELYSSGEIVDQLNKISGKKTEEFLRRNFGYAYMIDSGSRGSWDQARQIVLSRGFVSNFRGEIVSTPVKSSLLDGLTPEEFFISTYGSRKGLLDVALNTGFSGYLSRKLIFACTNLQKHPTLEDCGTTDHLKVEVDSERKAHMLVYRYYLNDDGTYTEVTTENYKNLIGKTINLRSPIYCKSYDICHKCYGNLYKLLNTRFVGIIAAQTLGERSTQLVLRTFHTSGVANIKGEKEDGDMKQDDIVADLSVASKLFHHFGNKKCDQIIRELFEIYNSNGKIHHIHIESIVAQLMWSGFTKWRLLKNRDEVEPEFYSIQKVPGYESWVLGLGFSNPKQHIIRGLLNGGNYYGIIDKILLGKKLQ